MFLRSLDGTQPKARLLQESPKSCDCLTHLLMIFARKAKSEPVWSRIANAKGITQEHSKALRTCSRFKSLQMFVVQKLNPESEAASWYVEPDQLAEVCAQ